MKRNAKRAIAALTIFMVQAPTFAQELNTSLPLTTIGQDLMWTVGDQSLKLTVPEAGRVRLELYSPQFDPSDYRSDRYYGDEAYSDKLPTTTFTLKNAAGQTVLTRTYGSGRHDWVTLIDQDLPAGEYHIETNTTGNGKNTFAVRLAGVRTELKADQLTVNVHSLEWVPAVHVNIDGPDYILRMYDGDGASELEARLVAPNGETHTLKVSGDLEWSDIPLPFEAGRYTIELRQPTHTKQYSNTIGFALKDRPLTVAEIDGEQLLQIDAELILPTGITPTSAQVTLAGKSFNVERHFEQKVEPGDYALAVAPVGGAQVTVQPAQLSIPKGGGGRAKVQIRPEVAVEIESDKAQVCVGDVVNITARATTAFAGQLPGELSLSAEGLTWKTAPTAQSGLSAAQPLVVHGEAIAQQPGQFKVSGALSQWQQSRNLNIEVLPSATSLELRREPLEAPHVGDTVTVRLSVTNTADVPVEFNLSDEPSEQLVPLDPVSWKGTLQPGETREVSYRAQVKIEGTVGLQAQLTTPGCAAVQTVRGSVQSGARELPPLARSSTLTLPFDAPAQAQTVLIAQALPQGASYVPGSSTLNGKSVADPLRGDSGKLYWQIKGESRGVLAYQVAHSDSLGVLPQPSLWAKLPGERIETLSGKIDQKDFETAKAIQAGEAEGENEGAIKLPLKETQVRVRDRITVVVEAPQGGTRPELLVNGTQVSHDQIGTEVQDSTRNVQRLTYVGVPLKAGPNVLRFGQDEITVYRVGATHKVELVPENLVADGGTPIRIRVRALDAYDKLTNQPTLTIRSNLEPRSPDAAPSEAGYQLLLRDGEGLLEIQPQSAPSVLNLEVLVDEKVETHRLNVVPDRSRVGVGVASATLGLDGNLDLSKDLQWQARGYAETPIGEGKLYVAADKDGLPKTENTLQRYSIYGDASTETVPLQGIDPVAAVYDHPGFRVAYKQTELPISVLPVGEKMTAFTAVTKSNPEVSGFAAGVPTDRVTNQEVVPDGTRVLRLNPIAPIVESSDTLEVVVREKGTGKELSRERLVLNTDYTLDYLRGIVTLVRPLARVDANFNDVVIVANYRLDGVNAERKLAYGAQILQRGQHHTLGAAVVSLDNTMTFGVRGTYDTETLKANALVAYSGGIQASADVSSQLSKDSSVSFKARYQDAGYKGLAPISVGLSVAGSYQAKITPLIGVAVDGEYHNNLAQTDAKSGGSVTGRVDAHFSPFTVGAGLKYGFGDIHGLGLVGKVAYDKDPLGVSLEHTQAFTGNLESTTNIAARYKFSSKATLGFTDRITWRKQEHAAALTLDSQLGNVNYAIGYELPTASGAGNRARFGVSTTLPLSDRLSLGVRGTALYDVAQKSGEVGAGADLKYQADNYSATVGGDVTYRQGHLESVVRGGVTGSVTENLTLSAEGTAEFRGEKGNGQRFSVGYAYRNRALSSLGFARYINGTMAAGKPELNTGISAEYRQPNWAVRGGFDTRTLLNDEGSFTAQYYAGATYYLTDWFGVGAWGRMISQPAAQFGMYGYGVEASVRALPGTWLSAGYNFKGFDGLPSAYTYTKPGAYLRLDVTLDETLGKGR